MNKIFRIVFNRTTGRWVVASEVARGRTKAARSTGALVASVLVVAGGLGVATPDAQAAVVVNGNPQEGTAGCETISDSGATTWTASSSSAACIVAAGTGASGQGNPGKRAVFYSSDSVNGNEDSLNLGGNLDVWKTATFWGGADMQNTKIIKLGNGLIAAGSTEAINGGQIYSSNAAIAAALGGGSTVNASGNVTAPSYALTNANSIAGGGGAAGDVGTGFAKVDSALGKLNTTVTNNSRYFKSSGANDGTDDASVASGGGVAMGAGAAAGNGTSGYNPTPYQNNVAIGRNANAPGGGSISIGDSAKTDYTNIAIGAGANAMGPRQSLAIGLTSTVTGWAAAAVGYKATAGGGNSVAMGTSATTTADNSVAMGVSSEANAINGVAMGNKAKANGVSSVSMGVGATTTTAASSGVAIGDSSTSNGSSGVAVGAAASAGANWTVAMGNDAQAQAVGDVALGTSTRANGGGSYATAVGTGARAMAANASAFGQGANATAVNSVAVGASSTTTADLTTAGYNPGSAALAGTASTANGEVSIGKAGGERRLTNLAAGSAATDAVNVSQLQAENATVDKQGADTAARFGGGSAYDATTGAISAPSYALTNANSIAGGGAAATDVGTGFSKVDAALGVLNTTANKGINISADAGATSQNIAPGGTAKFAAGSNATVSRTGDTITYGVVNNPTFTGMVTANGGLTVGAGQTVNMGANKVTNVAAGSAATDAVNKSQLDAVATTAGTGWNVQANGGAADKIAPGESVNFADGSNTTVAYDATTNKMQVNVSANPTFTSVTTGASKLDTTGLVITGGPSVTTSGINAGSKVISNVSTGLAGTDAVNKAQLDAAVTAVSSGAITFTGNDATAGTVARSSGQTLAIKGTASTAGTYSGSNLKTVTDPATGAINVQMADAPTFGAVTVNAGGTGKISGVTAGTAATDAINKGQLDALNTIVTKQGTDTASGLGGGSAYNSATGAVSAPSYTLTKANALGGTSGAATDVGSGFTKVDAALGNLDGRTTANTTNISSLQTTVNNINTGTAGLVQQAAAGANLTVGKDTDGAAVDFAGTAGARKLINVADGTVAANSKDAVNGGQLYTTNQQVQQQGTTTAAALGGGSTYNAVTGAVSAPAYTLANANGIGGTTGSVGDVGSALGRIDSALGTVNTTANKGFNVQANGGAADKIAPGESVNFADGSNTTVAYDATTNKMQVNVSANPIFTSVTTGNSKLDTTGLVITGGPSVTTSGINAGSKVISNVSDGVVATDAVNVGQLTSMTSALSNSPITFAGNNGANVARKLGETLAIKGAASTAGTYSGGNLRTVTDPATGAINIEMADAPTFGAVTVNAGGTGKITGVTDGTAAKDAVNRGQLDALNTIVTKQGTDTASGLGGGSAYNSATGAVSAPSYTLTTANKLGGSSGAATDVGSGFAKVDAALGNLDGRTTANTTNISSLQTTVNNINTGTAGLVQQSAAGANLTVGKATDGAAVDFAGTAGARKLINVADGTVAAGSKDAVNGGQLNTTNLQVQQQGTTTAAALGGGSAYNAMTGAVSAPSYTLTTANKLGGSSGAATDVGSGFTKVDAALGNLDGRVTTAEGNITNLDNRVTTTEGNVTNLDQRVTTNTTDISSLQTTVNNISTGTVGLVQQSAPGANLTVGKDTDGTEVSFAGTAGARKLTDVADGKVEANSKDAVNGGQLQDTNDRVTTAEGNITNLDNRVTTNEGDITNLQTTVNNISTGTVGLVQQSAAGANLTVGKDTDGAAVDFAGTAGARKLLNVEDGTVAANSKDAVNGGQLQDTNDRVTTAEGNITNLDNRVTTNEGNITNLDQRVTTNTTDISSLQTTVNNISTGTVGLVQQSAAGANLTVGKDTDGAAVDFAGTAGARKLVNVADGKVEANSKDAVNGGQLQDTNDRVTTAEGNITNLDNRVTTTEGNITNLDNRVTKNEGDISTLNTNVSNLDNRVTTNEGSITNLDQRVTKNEGDISTLNTNVSNIDSRVTNVEGSVTNLTTQINNGEVGLVQYDDASGTVTVAAAKAGTSVDFRNNAGASRQLKGVAAGADSEDAVNVSQLKSVVDGLGGGAKIDPKTGTVTGPTYYVTNSDGSKSEVNNVGDAVTNLDGRVYNNTTQITNLTQQIGSGTVGLVQQAAPGQKLTVGKDTDGTEVSFAGTAGARKLTDVADGTVAAGSKDAVNGGQLHTVSQSVADAMGGGSTVNNDGSISAPTYTVTNVDGSKSDVHNVGAAVTNLDGRVYQNTQAIANNTTQINNLTTQINNGGVGLVKQDAKTQEVTVAKASGGKSVNFAGTQGDRTLTGVAAGKADNDAVNVGQLKAAGIVDGNGQAKAVVAYDSADKTSVTLGGEGASKPVAIRNVADGVADHDAVNVSQLNDRLARSNTDVITQANSYTDQRIDDVWGGVNKVANELVRQDRRISEVGAMSMAEAQMTSNAAAASVGNPNGAWAIGVGTQEGHSALSAGYAKPIGEKSRISFGAAFSGHDQSIGIGFGRAL